MVFRVILRGVEGGMDNREAQYTSSHRAWCMGYDASTNDEGKSSCPVECGQTGSGGVDLFKEWNDGRSKRDLRRVGG